MQPNSRMYFTSSERTFFVNEPIQFQKGQELLQEILLLNKDFDDKNLWVLLLQPKFEILNGIFKTNNEDTIKRIKSQILQNFKNSETSIKTQKSTSENKYCGLK